MSFHSKVPLTESSFTLKTAPPRYASVEFGSRFYSAKLSRWLGRDPLEEDGGENLYGFIGNDPIDFVDPLGLAYGNPVPINATSPQLPLLQQPTCTVDGNLAYNFSNFQNTPGPCRVRIRIMPGGRIGIGFWECKDTVSVDVTVTGTCTKTCTCPDSTTTLNVSLSATVSTQYTWGIGFGPRWPNRLIGGARLANTGRAVAQAYARSQYAVDKVCNAMF